MDRPSWIAETPDLAYIIAADWSATPSKREAVLVDIGARSIRRIGAGWNVSSLLARAYELDGRVVVGIDAPIGAPSAYWAAIQPDGAPFVNAIAQHLTPEFLKPQPAGSAWDPRRPFVSIPAGAGSRLRWEEAVVALGLSPLRRIDRLTNAKSMFITSGIPGTVGLSTQDVWKGIVAARAGGIPHTIWPFEPWSRVTLAEIYPRLAYAVALSVESPATRSPLSLAKTGAATRERVMPILLQTDWVRTYDVSIENTESDIGEDAFDALLTGAALLRCVLERVPFTRPDEVDPIAEGAILGTGAVRLPEALAPSTPAVRVPAVLTPEPKIPAEVAEASPFVERPRIAENALAFAIADGFPVSSGHTLVLPRRVIASWFDATRDEQMAMLDLVEEVKRQLDASDGRPHGYNIGINVGAAAGQTVPHVHVHVIPRYAGDVADPRGGVRHVIPGMGNEPQDRTIS